jgi:hypothetical protein
VHRVRIKQSTARKHCCRLIALLRPARLADNSLSRTPNSRRERTAIPASGGAPSTNQTEYRPQALLLSRRPACPLTRNSRSTSDVTIPGNSLLSLTRNCHNASGVTLPGNRLLGVTRNCHSASGVTLPGNCQLGITRNCHSASGVTLSGNRQLGVTRNCHTGGAPSKNQTAYRPQALL